MHRTDSHDPVRMSKCLSRMLRHRPDLPHDEYGWFYIDDVVSRGSMTREQVMELAHTNHRYELSPEGDMIRACHGHSIEITYDVEVEPPEILYHGTSQKGFEGILRSSMITKMSRTKVHLSDDPEKAMAVGSRHSGGSPILLKVYAGRMYRAGMRFNLSNDGVYLTERVPLRYIEREPGTSVRHSMHLGERPFDRILSGRKTVELRLLDDKRRMVFEGDSIVFSCEDRSVLMRVVGLHFYPSFVELYDSLPKGMLGYAEDEVADPEDMLEFYDPDRIEEYGVVGIEVEPYNQM